MRPRIEELLMDKPFAALDAYTRESVQAELLRIWDATRKTILFVTHQIEEAVFLADRVLVFTVRPGTVKLSVTIGLGRPRDLMVKRAPEFIRYEETLWQAVRAEIPA
jgi:NitT/TauT family transport system ATP-binding protein